MFDTNLIGRENLNRIFTDAINIFEPSIVQKFINLCFKIAYKNNRNKPFYRCIIDTKNLTPSQIDEIKLLAK